MPNHLEQFEHLYRFFDRAVAFVMSLGFSKEDARDLAQDTFVRVFRSMEQYRQDARWNYIETTARRLVLNRIRDNLAQKRKASMALASEEELLNVTDGKPSPEEQATVRQSLERVLSAINKLPEKKRQCVLLSLGGQSYGEMARILDISENTVKSRLHEARSELLEKGIELPWSKN